MKERKMDGMLELDDDELEEAAGGNTYSSSYECSCGTVVTAGKKCPKCGKQAPLQTPIPYFYF